MSTLTDRLLNTIDEYMFKTDKKYNLSIKKVT